MTNQSVADAYARMAHAASDSIAASVSGKSRVTVQVGHCSQSVGARDVASALEAALPDSAYLVRAGCDGACYRAPYVEVTGVDGNIQHYSRVSPEDAHLIFSQGQADTDGSDFIEAQTRVTLDGCGRLDSSSIEEYIADGGYGGLARALSLSPEDVIAEAIDSGLRGRGGAYFPAGVKWQGARKAIGTPKYVVVNSEEGEPGIFKDRHLMEGVPHRILEGAIIAAYATGASFALIYINAEADLSAEVMQHAVDQASQFGIIGKDILGSGFELSVEIRRGAGGYVCGEETTLLNTVEGYRREPRLRPPFPTEAGLWAKPTVINNAETLASVPYVFAKGADAYSNIGTESDKGTKLISLSGAVKYPGVIEVPMGTSLRDIVFGIGGGPQDGHSIKALAVGGPSSGVMPVSMLDSTTVRPGMLDESGVMLGAGGIIALDENVDILEAVRNLAAYNADESCGKCTPCREGTPRMVDLLDKLIAGHGTVEDIEQLRYLAEVVNSASLCGLGQMAGNPITGSLHFFGEEFARLARVT